MSDFSYSDDAPFDPRGRPTFPMDGLACADYYSPKARRERALEAALDAGLIDLPDTSHVAAPLGADLWGLQGDSSTTSSEAFEPQALKAG